MTGPAVTNSFDALTFKYALVGTGDTHLTFSDGTDYSYGGPLASYDPAGNPCWRHALRTSPTSTIEGPVIVPADFHAWYTANGWEWDPRLDVNPPIAKLMPDAPVAATPAPSDPPRVPGSGQVLAPAAAATPTPHESLIQRARDEADKLEHGTATVWHALLALLTKIEAAYAATKAKL